MTSSTAGLGDGGAPALPPSVSHLLDQAPRSRFHRRTVVVSGVGFFTDASDLFDIGTVATLVATQWHLSTVETSWVTGSAILGAFLGAFVFGRIADVLGRTSVYVGVAVIMVIGALASALAPGFAWLVIARFVLGLGIGGDYPVSAVLMSEYSNRNDRGRMVGMVFSMQALGLIVGPLVGLILLQSGTSHDVAWRLLLGFGAIPAAGVICLRSGCRSRPGSRRRSRAGPDRRAKTRRPSPTGWSRPRQPTARRPGGWAWASSSRTARCWSCSSERPGRGSCSTTPTTATPCPSPRS